MCFHGLKPCIFHCISLQRQKYLIGEYAVQQLNFKAAHAVRDLTVYMSKATV